MATLHSAYHPDAGIARANVAEHIHGFHVQPSIAPRVVPRAGPVPVPVLRRGEPRVHPSPYQESAARVDIHDGPDARVTDVHVAGQDGVLKLAGQAAGQYDVPASGYISVAWLGDDVPEWTWTSIPVDPGER